MFENSWVQKYRPKTLDEMVLPDDIREYFEDVRKKQQLENHILFCGPAGTGKTTLAKVIADDVLDVTYMYINASDERGVDTIRSKVTSFAETRSFDGRHKIIILDEMDGLTGDAQRALRNTMEEYSANVKFILTANYKNLIRVPLKSRALEFELIPPFDGCVARCVEILKKEKIKVENGSKEKLLKLIRSAYPDLRHAIKEITRYIKDGVLNIVEREKEYTAFAEQVFEKLQNESIRELRKFIIENEQEFNSDYQFLLKSMFEVIYRADVPDNKKSEAMTIIGDGLVNHAFVMDFEINAFCTLLKVKKILA